MNNIINIKDGVPVIDSHLVTKIIMVEDKIKELKKTQDEYKKLLINAMEEHDIVKVSDYQSGLTITYVEAKENLEKFNAERFREENPEMYDKYVIMDGKKSAYIAIRLK